MRKLLHSQGRRALILTALLLGACDPCERGSSDGEEDAWTDVESCNEYGTTRSEGWWSRQSAGYGECYPQVYDSIYSEYIEENCGSSYI